MNKKEIENKLQKHRQKAKEMSGTYERGMSEVKYSSASEAERINSQDTSDQHVHKNQGASRGRK